jgi:histidinol phosphatase-like enzyme
VPELDAGLRDGRRRWVLDNTYPSRKSRNEVIETAWMHGVPVRCVWMTTSVADAQINAILRMIDIHGRLPTPEDIRARGKEDPRFFGPDAQFRYERSVEPPTVDEGFTEVEARPFVRRPSVGEARAIVLDYDDLVLGTTGAADAANMDLEDLTIREERRPILERYSRDGWLLFAHAWRPGVAAGRVTPTALLDQFARVQARLGVPIEIAYCPHEAGPPVCWCRKPLPGSILDFALRHHVALDRSMIVGHSVADRTLAERLGIAYHHTDDFFTLGE